MTSIPPLTLQQLELLRLAKKYPGKTIQISYEFPAINDMEPPIAHPPFIQKLIDAQLIQVQVTGTDKRYSEFQQQRWAEFCQGIDQPSQADWEKWRQSFITQLDKGASLLMAPGVRFEQFCKVWTREIGIQAIQPKKL